MSLPCHGHFNVILDNIHAPGLEPVHDGRPTLSVLYVRREKPLLLMASHGSDHCQPSLKLDKSACAVKM